MMGFDGLTNKGDLGIFSRRFIVGTFLTTQGADQYASARLKHTASVLWWISDHPKTVLIAFVIEKPL